MVAQNPAPPQGGNTGHPPSGDASSSSLVFMCNETIDLMTRTNTYDTPPGKMSNESLANGTVNDTPSTSATPPSRPLQIEKPNFDSILRPPKSTIRRSTFNPNTRASQNYNIVEDLAQAPCAMSTLEVLQNCPSQRRTLLESIGVVDPESSNTITFNLEDYKTRLSHQLAFQIQVVVWNQSIHRTILDEGASTCVMSLSCWKPLGSPSLNQSPTTLKSFDG
jgi:hypothetical protein